MSNNIYFKTIAAANLFSCEIKRQISDGMWKNDEDNNWQYWYSQNVGVNKIKFGRDNITFGRIDFDIEQLREYVEERMIMYIALGLLNVECYKEKEDLYYYLIDNDIKEQYNKYDRLTNWINKTFKTIEKAVEFQSILFDYMDKVTDIQIKNVIKEVKLAVK